MRWSALFVVGALVTIVVPDANARPSQPPRGVFGTINAKSFKAKNLGGATDACVFGIYEPATTTLVFTALECKARRRRQGNVKKNYKILVMACANYAGVDTSTPPFELTCPGSAYTETKTGRFRQPVSQTIWGANFEFLEDFSTTSNLRMRIDAIDGANVRGAFHGVFELPLQGDASPPAAVSGEVTFDFPFEIQSAVGHACAGGRARGRLRACRPRSVTSRSTTPSRTSTVAI